jgi:hypothetical protein
MSTSLLPLHPIMAVMRCQVRPRREKYDRRQSAVRMNDRHSFPVAASGIEVDSSPSTCGSDDEGLTFPCAQLQRVPLHAKVSCNWP